MSVFDDDPSDDFIIEAGDLTPDDMDDVGGRVEKTGYYHVTCVNVKTEEPVSAVPAKRLDLQILEGDHKSEIGRFVYHRMNLKANELRDAGNGEMERTGAFIPLSPGARKIMARFFVNLGLINRDDMGKGAVKLPFSKLPGMQFIVKVSDDPYKDKQTGKMISSLKIKFSDVYAIDDERVRDVPKDQEALKMLAAQGGGVNVDDI